MYVLPGEPRPYLGENAESAAVKGLLVFWNAMGSSEVLQGGQPCKHFARSKQNNTFWFFGDIKTSKMENSSQNG